VVHANAFTSIDGSKKGFDSVSFHNHCGGLPRNQMEINDPFVAPSIGVGRIDTVTTVVIFVLFWYRKAISKDLCNITDGLGIILVVLEIHEQAQDTAKVDKILDDGSTVLLNPRQQDGERIEIDIGKMAQNVLPPDDIGVFFRATASTRRLLLFVMFFL
jgi:hypothetical protein